MAKGSITNVLVTSSTALNDDNNANSVALRLLPEIGLSGTGWRPTEQDTNPWLQFIMDEVYVIRAIVTQGCGNGEYWVTEYCLSYSSDGMTPVYYMASDTAQDCTVSVILIRSVTVRQNLYDEYDNTLHNLKSTSFLEQTDKSQQYHFS